MASFMLGIEAAYSRSSNGWFSSSSDGAERWRHSETFKCFSALMAEAMMTLQVALTTTGSARRLRVSMCGE